MTPTPYQTARARLKAAAVTIDGRLWVRRHIALEIIQSTTGHGCYVQRAGKVRVLTVEAPRTQAEPNGRRVYWDARSTARLARKRLLTRRGRPWSRQDVRTLREMAGLKSEASIARRLGREAGAVRLKMTALGLRTHQHVIDKHGLLTTARLSRVLRVHHHRIWDWRTKYGLPVARYRECAKRQTPLFRLADVRRWLAGRPDTLTHIHPDARRLLRLTAADLEREQRRAA